MNNINDANYEAETAPADQKGSWNAASNGMYEQPEAAADVGYVDNSPAHNHTAMFLLGLCMLGMLGVYLFGAWQKPEESSDEEKAVEAQVDTALAKLVNIGKEGQAQKLFRDTQNMVDAFYEYPSQQQVAVNDLRKNPFVIYEQKTDNSKEDELAKSRAQRAKELKKKYAQLELQSILYNSKSSKCLINGRIFIAGQKVMSTFDIKAINEDRVTLIADSQEFILKL